MTKIRPYGPSSKEEFKVSEPIANGDVVSHEDMSAFLRKYQV
ncbi:hypothetical protein [uncultured Parabacteroides sp.]|nr:hypothetical protein [uncultured Parabacteroides sp.]